jgi:hypothetical protein
MYFIIKIFNKNIYFICYKDININCNKIYLQAYEIKIQIFYRHQ